MSYRREIKSKSLLFQKEKKRGWNKKGGNHKKENRQKNRLKRRNEKITNDKSKKRARFGNEAYEIVVNKRCLSSYKRDVLVRCLCIELLPSSISSK